MRQKNKLRADYGQDVPGLMREKILFEGILVAEGGIIIRRSSKSKHLMPRLLSLLGVAALVSGVLAILEGLALIECSRVGVERVFYHE
jgi:uncharacterized membrane protein